MKTITCLVLAVILLSFIVEISDGKITILHEGRVSGTPKRKSRRKTVRKRPSRPANEDNGNSTQDHRRRPVVCNHNMCSCFCFKIAFTLVSLFVISKRRPHEKKKNCLNLFSFRRNTRDGTSPHDGFETMFTSQTKRRRYCYRL